VNKYLDLAIPKIDEILSRGKLPIVVGGTNYYIEGLLFEKQQTEEEFNYDSEKFNEALNKARETLDQKYSELIEEFRKLIPIDNKAGIEEKYSGQESLLHDLLKTVDPKMGEYLHSKDRRRVINALFKYFKYLYQASDEKVVRESDI
jgi:tRNA dimethylallyltransferase